MARVSVLVPAYNAAWCLPEALASLASQTFRDWEAIVADDGSTDGTSSTVPTDDPRIRVVRSDVNRGLAATRNLALRHADSELIALLDSDDTWMPDYLEHQVALYDRAQARWGDVGIVCCDAYLRQGTRRLDETYGQRFGRPDGDVTTASLLHRNVIFVGALLPREVVERAGGFDEQLRSVEDLDLWLRIVELGWRVVYQPLALADYRIGASGLSQDTLTMARSRQVVIRQAIVRGRLDARGRRAAAREMRLQRGIEQVELARARWRTKTRAAAVAQLLRASPLLLAVGADRMLRWR